MKQYATMLMAASYDSCTSSFIFCINNGMLPYSSTMVAGTVFGKVFFLLCRFICSVSSGGID